MKEQIVIDPLRDARWPKHTLSCVQEQRKSLARGLMKEARNQHLPSFFFTYMASTNIEFSVHTIPTYFLSYLLFILLYLFSLMPDLLNIWVTDGLKKFQVGLQAMLHPGTDDKFESLMLTPSFFINTLLFLLSLIALIGFLSYQRFRLLPHAMQLYMISFAESSFTIMLYANTSIVAHMFQLAGKIDGKYHLFLIPLFLNIISVPIVFFAAFRSVINVYQCDNHFVSSNPSQALMWYYSMMFMCCVQVCFQLASDFSFSTHIIPLCMFVMLSLAAIYLCISKPFFIHKPTRILALAISIIFLFNSIYLIISSSLDHEFLSNGFPHMYLLFIIDPIIIIFSYLFNEYQEKWIKNIVSKAEEPDKLSDNILFAAFCFRDKDILRILSSPRIVKSLHASGCHSSELLTLSIIMLRQSGFHSDLVGKLAVNLLLSTTESFCTAVQLTSILEEFQGNNNMSEHSLHQHQLDTVFSLCIRSHVMLWKSILVDDLIGTIQAAFFMNENIRVGNTFFKYFTKEKPSKYQYSNSYLSFLKFISAGCLPQRERTLIRTISERNIDDHASLLLAPENTAKSLFHLPSLKSETNQQLRISQSQFETVNSFAISNEDIKVLSSPQRINKCKLADEYKFPRHKLIFNTLTALYVIFFITTLLAIFVSVFMFGRIQSIPVIIKKETVRIKSVFDFAVNAVKDKFIDHENCNNFVLDEDVNILVDQELPRVKNFINTNYSETEHMLNSTEFVDAAHELASLGIDVLDEFNNESEYITTTNEFYKKALVITHSVVAGIYIIELPICIFALVQHYRYVKEFFSYTQNINKEEVAKIYSMYVSSQNSLKDEGIKDEFKHFQKRSYTVPYYVKFHVKMVIYSFVQFGFGIFGIMFFKHQIENFDSLSLSVVHTWPSGPSVGHAVYLLPILALDNENAEFTYKYLRISIEYLSKMLNVYNSSVESTHFILPFQTTRLYKVADLSMMSRFIDVCYEYYVCIYESLLNHEAGSLEFYMTTYSRIIENVETISLFFNHVIPYYHTSIAVNRATTFSILLVVLMIEIVVFLVVIMNINRQKELFTLFTRIFVIIPKNSPFYDSINDLIVFKPGVLKDQSRKLIEKMPVLFLQIDPDYKILDINPKTEEYFGDIRKRSAVKACLTRAIKNGKPYYFSRSCNFIRNLPLNYLEEKFKGWKYCVLNDITDSYMCSSAIDQAKEAYEIFRKRTIPSFFSLYHRYNSNSHLVMFEKNCTVRVSMPYITGPAFFELRSQIMIHIEKYSTLIYGEVIPGMIRITFALNQYRTQQRQYINEALLCGQYIYNLLHKVEPHQSSFKVAVSHGSKILINVYDNERLYLNIYSKNPMKNAKIIRCAMDGEMLVESSMLKGNSELMFRGILTRNIDFGEYTVQFSVINEIVTSTVSRAAIFD